MRKHPFHYHTCQFLSLSRHVIAFSPLPTSLITTTSSISANFQIPIPFKQPFREQDNMSLLPKNVLTLHKCPHNVQENTQRPIFDWEKSSSQSVHSTNIGDQLCSCSLFSHYMFPHKSRYSYTYNYNNKVLEQPPHNAHSISNAVWKRLALLLPHASMSNKFYLDPHRMTQCINRPSVTQFPKSIQLLRITE